MPALPSSNPAQFVQGAPVLRVPDVKSAATYYRDVLGFTWDFGDEDYAVVWRDNSAIHFVKDAASPRGIHLFQWVKNVVTHTNPRIWQKVLGGGRLSAGSTRAPAHPRAEAPCRAAELRS